MSTNCSISTKNQDGGRTIYGHWDGYPSNNGLILKKYYNTQEKVDELISMGNVSILHKNIGIKVKFDGFNSLKQKQCLFYGRDREETEQEPTTFSFDKPKLDTLQAWNYMFFQGKWYVSKGLGEFQLMTYKFIKENKY